LKQWECIQANPHKNVGKVIEEWEARDGVYTYDAAEFSGSIVNHYLLFEKGKKLHFCN